MRSERVNPERAPVQVFILHANIMRFRRLLAEGRCADERDILNSLLADEEARLAELISGQAAHTPGPDGAAEMGGDSPPCSPMIEVPGCAEMSGKRIPPPWRPWTAAAFSWADAIERQLAPHMHARRACRDR
jgi:hypothetical protein